MFGQNNSIENEVSQNENKWLFLSDEAENEASNSNLNSNQHQNQNQNQNQNQSQNQMDEILEVTIADQSAVSETIEIQSEYIEEQNTEDFDRIDFSPVDDKLNFEQRKAEINEVFNGYVSSLVNKIEEQASIITEKNLELEEKDIQLKLIPDLQKQLQSKEEETRIEYFEAQALKKQLELMKADKETTEKVARITKTILKEVERDASDRSLEIESAKETKQQLSLLKEEIANLRKPWWQKLLGSKLN